MENNINEIEKEAIRILTETSKNKDTLYEYTDKIDLHQTLKKRNTPKYNIKILKELDLTYINIKAEEEYQKWKQ